MIATTGVQTAQSQIKLQPKQRQLLELCRATGAHVPTIIGFGGARGGAKSGAVRRIALSLLLEFPNTTAHIIQLTSKSLYDNHLVPIAKEFPWLDEFWFATRNEYQLPNGSRLAFRYADTPKDVTTLTRGPEPTWSFVDQAEQFPQGDLEAIKVGTRDPNTAVGLSKLILTFNPGGPGTGYLRRVFHIRDFHDNEDPGDYVFLKAVGWDNYEWFKAECNLAPAEFYRLDDKARFELFITKTAYGRRLWALPESQRLGELYGSFDQFAGQYFADVWEESAVTIPADLVARILQPWWTRWLATDWGFSHYAATGWYASGLLTPEQCRGHFGVSVSGMVRIIIKYRELVTNDVTEPDLARLIYSMTPQAERREVKAHYMSPDAWAKRGSANTVVEQMEPLLQREGLPRMTRADDDRQGGWRLIYNCLQQSKKLRKSESYKQAEEEAPVFLISEACPETISAFPVLICKKDNPQDVQKVPGEASDDVADETRYALKSHLSANLATPFSVTQQETYEAYQDPTERAMRMLRLQVDRESSQHIRRRRRP